MMPEFERPRFRRGENARKPYGGKISDDPFSQALRKSALASGFESQNVLAKALEIRQSTVCRWYRGESTPTPSGFGDLLVLFNLNDKEQEPLVEVYANRLVEQKELRAKNHRDYMKASNSPLGKWIEDTCKEKNITLGKLSKMLGHNSHLEKRLSLSLGSLEHIRQNAKEALGLSKEQADVLSRLIDREIEQRINRQTVSNLRKRFGLPYLLTVENLNTLRKYLEKTEDRRKKSKQTMMEKRTGNLGERDLTIFQ